MQANRLEQTLQNNEDAVMVSFREGNKDAFRLIYDQLVRPLTYFVENIIHSQPDAEDIVANAFYKLYHARTALRSYEHVKRWMYVIVRNEAIDYLRARTRARENQHDIAYLETGVVEQAETERIKANLLQDIHKEIEKLPKQRKTILRLYFFEQKSTTEIAELMELSPQTVLNHKTKAIDSLRKSGLRFKWLLDGVTSFVVAAAFYLLK
jgi:RNA polymerase sigma-70 factor (ECF subfamily)